MATLGVKSMYLRVMPRRTTRQGLLSITVGGVVSLATAQAPTEKLDQVVAKYDTKTAPGVEILVVEDGKELYRRTAGMANVEYGIPITKDSIFHIASVSKQFTAFAACLLEQEGKLNMDDDVRKYLPELPNYGTKITLRNLATHTSGLRDYYALSAQVGLTEADVWYNSQVHKLLFQQKNLNFKPGTRFEYGNSSFTLLGEVVARVAKKPLSEFPKERVFTPLGMNQTQLVDDPELIIANRAYSYYTQGGVLYKRLLGPVNVGSTGINSTAADLVRWSQNFENPKVGNQKLFQRMSERTKKLRRIRPRPGIQELPGRKDRLPRWRRCRLPLLSHPSPRQKTHGCRPRKLARILSSRPCLRRPRRLLV